MSLTYRIFAEHLVQGRLVPGEEVQLRVDQALLQDATGTMACLELEQLRARGRRDAGETARDGQAIRPALEHFEALGVERIGIPFGIVYVDHNVLAVDFKNPDDHRFLRTFCARYGLHYSRAGTRGRRSGRPGHDAGPRGHGRVNQSRSRRQRSERQHAVGRRQIFEEKCRQAPDLVDLREEISASDTADHHR
jgi:hypothetical protein